MKEELLNVKGATETVLLYRLELLAPCPMPSHPIRKASLFLGGERKETRKKQASSKWCHRGERGTLRRMVRRPC